MCIKEPRTPPLGRMPRHTHLDPHSRSTGTLLGSWFEWEVREEACRALAIAGSSARVFDWIDLEGCGDRSVGRRPPRPDRTHLTRSGSNCIKLLVYVRMLLQVRDLGPSPRRQAVCGNQIIEDERCRSGPGPAA